MNLIIDVFTALSGNASKLLLAAKKIRRATKTDFAISFAADDFSRANDSYVGKLRFVYKCFFFLGLL